MQSANGPQIGIKVIGEVSFNITARVGRLKPYLSAFCFGENPVVEQGMVPES